MQIAHDDIAYGYLDESPSLSDKEYFFCVDIVCTNDRINRQLNKIIKQARKRIVKKNLRSLEELKFHTADEKTRMYVLAELAKQEVHIVVVVVDKGGRQVADTPENYGIVVGATVAECLSEVRALCLTADKKYTKPEQESEFLKVTQEVINRLVPQGKTVFFNPPAESQRESIIQLADFVAGAFNAKYNHRDGHYSEVIIARVAKEKVIKWLEIKKRIVNPQAPILTASLRG